MNRGHMLCVGCVEEFPEGERHGSYCHKCYLAITEGIVWKEETNPAPKEEEMKCVDCGTKCADVPICNDCNEKRRKRCDRTTERRALAREAYMAALGGYLTKDPCPSRAVGAATAIALETVRRWDAFLAAVDAEGGE